MKNNRLVTVIMAAVATLFFGSVVVFAVITTVEVFPGSLQDWQPQTVAGAQPTPASTPSVTFVFGPATPPLGRGSAQLSVGSDGSAAAQLRQPDFAGTVLPNPSPTPDELPAGNELTVLSYSTYVQVGGSANQAPYIVLDVDYDNNGSVDDHLVFEPQYQVGGFCSTNAQGPVAPGVWQTWDAFNGCWYSTTGVAGSGPGANVKTLTAFRAAQPDAKIVNAVNGDGGVRIVAGFGGVIGGGAASDWANFVGNADAFKIGVGFDTDTGPNGNLYDFEPKAPPVNAARGVIISEIRNSGPGVVVTSPGKLVVSPGSGDEYVELYNATGNDISVTSDDGSGGWSLVRRGATCVDPPVVVATIPDGTIIPARGHYLLAAPGYSLGSYPAGDGSAQFPQTSATPDLTYNDSISGDVDVGLFNTKDSAFFNTAHRLDAVGFNNGSGNTCDLLTEGTPLPNTRDSAQQYAFVRKETLSDVVQDTDNNAADFIEVSTDPTTNVGDNASPVLGSPGPQNTSSPVNRNDGFSNTLFAPSVAQELPPNRERNTTPDGSCSPLGTLKIRRTVTNNTGSFISRLRFRVVSATTVNSPDFGQGAQAILHVRTSSNETVTGVPGRGDVNVRGLTDEQEIFQNETQCGGMNDSLTDDTISLESPLAPGATIDIVFLLGVEQPGYYRFFVNVEALETSPPTSKPAGPTRVKKPGPSLIPTPFKPTGGTTVETPTASPVQSPTSTTRTQPGVWVPLMLNAPPNPTRDAKPDASTDETPTPAPDKTPEAKSDTTNDAKPVKKRKPHESNLNSRHASSAVEKTEGPGDKVTQPSADVNKPSESAAPATGGVAAARARAGQSGLKSASSTRRPRRHAHRRRP